MSFQVIILPLALLDVYHASSIMMRYASTAVTILNAARTACVRTKAGIILRLSLPDKAIYGL